MELLRGILPLWLENPDDGVSWCKEKSVAPAGEAKGNEQAIMSMLHQI